MIDTIIEEHLEERGERKKYLNEQFDINLIVG